MDPILGTVMLSPYSFAPQGWMFCNGQALNINNYNALYALLGTQYGGDGKTTFALPDLRDRIPVAVNNIVAPDRIVTAPVDAQGKPTRNGLPGDTLGANVLLSSTGVVSAALTVNNLPAHTHAATASAGTATVSVSIDASLDEGTEAAPMAGGYLAVSTPTGNSISNIYVPALGPGGSVSLAKASGDVSFTPTVTNASTGGGQPFQAAVTVTATAPPTPPFLAMQYIIAVEGVFPMRN